MTEKLFWQDAYIKEFKGRTGVPELVAENERINGSAQNPKQFNNHSTNGEKSSDAYSAFLAKGDAGDKSTAGIWAQDASLSEFSKVKRDEVDRPDRLGGEESINGASAATEFNRSAVLIEARVRSYKRDGEEESYFAVLKREIEDKAGTRLDLGGTYLMEARVNDSIELSLRRVMTPDRYLRIYVPEKYARELKRGDVCKITIKSVERVSQSAYRGSQNLKLAREWASGENSDVQVAKPASFPSDGLGPFEVISKAYQRPGDNSRVSFKVWKPGIEREKGVRFEKGKIYDIDGRIGDVCGFKTWHTETGHTNYFPIYVPKESLAKVHPGERYSIRIDTLRERTQVPAEAKPESSSVWDWKMVAAWIDTEGTYYGKGNGTFTVMISQKERQPLEGIRDFFGRAGIAASIRKQPNSDNYYLRTRGGIESLAKIILETEPYIVTANKKAQTEAFKAELVKPKKIENYHRKNARQILGSEVPTSQD